MTTLVCRCSAFYAQLHGKYHAAQVHCDFKCKRKQQAWRSRTKRMAEWRNGGMVRSEKVSMLSASRKVSLHLCLLHIWPRCSGPPLVCVCLSVRRAFGCVGSWTRCLASKVVRQQKELSMCSRFLFVLAMCCVVFSKQKFLCMHMHLYLCNCLHAKRKRAYAFYAHLGKRVAHTEFAAVAGEQSRWDGKSTF